MGGIVYNSATTSGSTTASYTNDNLTIFPFTIQENKKVEKDMCKHIGKKISISNDDNIFKQNK